MNNKIQQRDSFITEFILLTILLILLFIWSVGTGSVSLGIADMIDIIGGDQTKKVYYRIFTEIRIPKALTAVCCGMSLSVCGLMMQTLFRNPLAGPYILGINSGASLFVAFIITGTSALGFSEDSILLRSGVPLTAVTGSILTLLIILLFSSRMKNNITLLLTGIMLGYIYGALQNLLEFFANPTELKSFALWGMGSMQNTQWKDLSVFIPVSVIGIFLAFILIKPMNLLLLGDNYAKSSGLNLQSSKWKIIIVTGILSGISTAFCGPIAFIGLAVPHLTRILFKTANHKILIPAVALTGAVLLLFCDVISNFGPSGQVIPINVTTSFIGAPVVIWLLLKNKRMSAS